MLYRKATLKERFSDPTWHYWIFSVFFFLIGFVILGTFWYYLGAGILHLIKWIWKF